MKKNINLDKTTAQLLKWYNSKVKKKQVEIMTFEIFHAWYLKNANTCHYCNLTAQESQKIVKTGLLKSKRFPQHGIVGRGTSRGMWMEIDRYDPKGNYEIGNIVPACYFCNNDKSDVFTGDQYKKFIKDRIGFLRNLFNSGVEEIDKSFSPKENSEENRITITKLKGPTKIERIELPKIPNTKEVTLNENEEVESDTFSSNIHPIDNISFDDEIGEVIGWRCEICDGDHTTGCLLYDRECLRN
jgi:hypothetical protein